MKKVAVILILVGLIGAVFTAKDFFTRENIKGEAYFSSMDIEDIKITSDVANILVLPANSDDIRVKWEDSFLKSNRKNDFVSINEEDSELVITAGDKSFFSINFFGFNFFNKRQVEVYLPEKQYRSIVIHNDIGSTNISSIKVDHLTTETSVSNLTIKDVQANDIRATSDVGLITLEDFTGELFAKSSVGNISIRTEEITNAMEIESDIGNIKLTVPTIPDNISFYTHSEIGSVNVFGEKGSYHNEQADHNISLETSVGNITVKSLE